MWFLDGTLFCLFLWDRHWKVIGYCWYDEGLCSEQYLRVSDLNEARGDARRRPKKSFSKTPGKHFSMHFWSFGTKLIFSPLENFFFRNFFKSQVSGVLFLVFVPKCDLCDFCTRTLFCLFLWNRDCKVIGHCWYDEGAMFWAIIPRLGP